MLMQSIVQVKVDGGGSRAWERTVEIPVWAEFEDIGDGQDDVIAVYSCDHNGELHPDPIPIGAITKESLTALYQQYDDENIYIPEEMEA